MMIPPPRILIPLALLGFTALASADVIFQDGFESDTLNSAWTLSSTNEGQVQISPGYSPASGSQALVFDDSVNDAIYSVAEATLSLDLTRQRAVTLTFKAKSLGDEPDAPPTGNFGINMRQFDGVSISADGGVTWRSVQSLANLSSDWTEYSVNLDSSVTAVGGKYGPGFLIRFSQYDNSSAPLDGIAIDDVSVSAIPDQRVALELPSSIAEGDGAHTGYIESAYVSDQPLTVTLSASPVGAINLPASVVIPAGSTFQSFSFSAMDDNIINGTRTVSVTAATDGAQSGTTSLSVIDNDSAKATLTLPAQLVEGATATNNAKLSLDRVTSTAMTFTLAATPSGEITLPSSVTVPAGQSEIAFTMNAVNDTRLDGNIAVTVTASRSGIDPATATVTAVDNESRAIGLTLPATLAEGASGTGTGKVTIGGTLTTPLVINLSSSIPAALQAPATVTIPAGSTQVTFTVTAIDNTVADGTRQASLTASADTLTSGTATVSITDNDPASYQFAAMPGIVDISHPVPITLTGYDLSGTALSNLTGSMTLSVVLPDGTTQTLTSPSITLTGASYTGTVTLPVINVAPLKIRATDVNGITAETTEFDIMRVIPLVAADLQWDGPRGVLYASIPQGAATTYANQVISIDPESLTVTGSVTTNQSPGQMVMTSGGEYLYTALNSNGTISKIDLATKSVASNFAVGTSTSYGTLYASDMAAVTGQPEVLVVSQSNSVTSSSANGVAVYDHGVARPVKTGDYPYVNLIEPSSDPSIFFGLNTEDTEFGFRRLKVDTNGVTIVDEAGGLINSFNTQIVSQGDLVFSSTGVEIDGSKLRQAGSFYSSQSYYNNGSVRPDLAANRVYFIERADTNSYSGNLDTLTAYDPHSFAKIRSLSLPVSYDYYSSRPKSFIRWGASGLAYLTPDSIVLITSPRLVPSQPPADLEVTVKATPELATVGSSVTYTVQVTNHGPNISNTTSLTAVLSDSQTLGKTTATDGTPSISGSVITSLVGDLGVGASSTMTITTSPDSAGAISCTGSVNSYSMDPNPSNNLGFKLVTAGFQPGTDTANKLRLAANNLVYDSSRKLFWATIPMTESPPLSRSLVSIDPQTGYVSSPLALSGNPAAKAMAISSNCRYLYIGLTDSSEVLRMDLSATPVSATHIPLALSQWGDINHVQDIEVLGGDGTSFIMTGTDDHSASIYDGFVQRPDMSGIYTVDMLAPTSDQALFVGYNNYTSGYDTSSLRVTSTGVKKGLDISNLVTGYNVGIVGEGNLLAASSGRIIDSSTFTLKTDLGFNGRPAVDSRYNRVYMVTNNSIFGYDATTGATFGSLPLPTALTGDWAQSCIRWGTDGFAIVGGEGNIYIARWSASIPAGVDHDGDGIPDAWAAKMLNSTSTGASTDTDGDGIPDRLEYLFGTDPQQADMGNPMKASLSQSGGQTSFHLTFPRRSGVGSSAYRYETSSDMVNWTTVSQVTESVLSSKTVNGVAIDTIDAAIPMTGSGARLFRIAWAQP